VERATGKGLWKFPTGGKVESAPVVAGDKVVFGSDDGSVYMVSLADGKQLWSYEIGQAVASSPAVADEKIVIGSDDGGVYCFGQKG
jgi:outer membrane protein assembly factor BamB